jgi:cytochrome c biogenesis protein CcdA
MIFVIAPLVQEASTRRRWLVTLGVFTGSMLVVLGGFGAAMAWAGTAAVSTVTTPLARELIASLALTAVGLLSVAVALGELGLTRSLLPRLTSAPDLGSLGSLRPRSMALALAFGATMAIFSPLATYSLVIGWVASHGSVWLGAVTLMAYGLGLTTPLALAGMAVARRSRTSSGAVEVWQERIRVVGGVSMALAGGFLLSMWTLRATWVLFHDAIRGLQP